MKLALLGGVVGALLSGIAGLIGVAMTNGAQTEMQAVQAQEDRAQQQRQFDDQRDTATRTLRRPIYLAYLDKAQNFANAHRTRNDECKPGTDEPRKPGGTCSVRLMVELQNARYEYRGAANDLATVGTARADAASERMAAAMPSNAPGPNGAPYEGEVDSDAFNSAYLHFLEVTACDTSPTPSKC